jgi:hypothetical protein
MMETLVTKLTRYGYHKRFYRLYRREGLQVSGDGGANGALGRGCHCRPVRINQA